MAQDENAPLVRQSTRNGGYSAIGSQSVDFCDAHATSHNDPVRLAARRRLLIACCICFTFMCVEVVGGYLSGSLAIMTDAAHLLSDMGGFFISLFAIWLAGLPPSQEMSFGYQRAEIIGATLSVFLIWMLTGILVYEAVLRLITPEELDGKIMFITAALGFGANVIMAATLGVHGHSHGPGGHGHSHGGGGHSHSHGDEEGLGHGGKQPSSADVADNINVKAAYIHVLGDMVQSLGVMLAAGLIWWQPTWHFLDPICTMIFAVIVLLTTFSLLKEALHVLMEGTPRGINPHFLRKELEKIAGVVLAHDMHIWSITAGQPAIAMHLTVTPTADGDRERILLEAQDICAKNGIHHITIQLEKQNLSSRCSVAQADVSTMISRRSTLTEPQWPGQPPTIPAIPEDQSEHAYDQHWQ